MDQKITEILELAVANGASDVHLYENQAPKIRIHGELTAINVGEFNDGVSLETLMSMLRPEQVEKLKSDRELDFSLSIASARFRVNAYYQRGGVAVALRVVNDEIPTMDSLKLPEILHSFAKLRQGFILITGPTGHGKSTTVASMLDEINGSGQSHIVTVEDPIEYLIKPKKSLISQRELGSDTLSFASALKSCLRQDPNVVFVGEMRDLETISAALTVAETGHLVFSTLHTNSASQTISRIIDAFPEGSKDQIRVQLAEVITAVISQRLVPAINGGRVPAMEVLIALPSVKNIIRDNKAFMIDNVIQTGTDVGMMSLEMSLSKLVREGVISEEVAMAYSLKPAELQTYLRKAG